MIAISANSAIISVPVNVLQSESDCPLIGDWKIFLYYQVKASKGADIGIILTTGTNKEKIYDSFRLQTPCIVGMKRFITMTSTEGYDISEFNLQLEHDDELIPFYIPPVAYAYKVCDYVSASFELKLVNFPVGCLYDDIS